MMTQADRWALSDIRQHALMREIFANVREYGKTPLTNSALTPGMDCIWLWKYNDVSECDPIPIRAIVLQLKNGKTQIRAQFESGPIVLWTHARRLRSMVIANSQPGMRTT